tara:strand:+ start:1419 stop:1556 length:138 start_codon:yes stop_codon:yes gene_type:complete
MMPRMPERAAKKKHPTPDPGALEKNMIATVTKLREYPAAARSQQT